MLSSTRLMILLIIGFGSTTVTAQVLCLSSQSSTVESRVQLTLPKNNSVVAFVKHNGEDGEKAITRLREKIVSKRRKVPATVRATFTRKSYDGNQHTYVLTTQGGMVGELVYINSFKKQRIVLYDDQSAYGAKGCEWGESDRTTQ